MTSRSSITCMIFSLLMFSSCRSGQYDAATAELKNFLAGQFHRSIPDDRHYFLLIPSNKCPKCITLDGKDYSAEFAGRLTIVSSIAAENFLHLDDVVYDLDDQVMKLGFIEYKPKLVISEAAEIVSVLDFDPNRHQLDSLYRLEHSTVAR